MILACDKRNFRITQCSENSSEILRFKVSELVGKPLSVLLAENSYKGLNPGKGEKILLPEAKFNNSSFLVIAHTSEESLILEFEPLAGSTTPVNYQEQLSRILNELTAAESIEQMCNKAAYLVKTLFGYDRVMLYHFDEEWNGEVIAEEKEEKLESWLGLHYPATDIPKPSRDLFLKQGVRMISDVNYSPAVITPEYSPINNKPLDLSRSELRAVSPIHIEYLKNMGVGASLTAAIVLNGKLWGLLACHHYIAKFVDYYQRQSVKFLTQIFTNRLAVKTTEISIEKSRYSLEIRKKLVEQMDNNQDIISAITKDKTSFTEIISCSGGAVFLEDEIELVGKTPSREEVQHLVENLLNRQKIFHTNQLEKIFRAAGAYKDVASGVLSVQIGESEKNLLIWFREETSESVNWGGKPEKDEVIKGGVKYLSPRNSFKKWTQKVSGISRPWRDYEFDAAIALQESITHKIVQQQKEEINDLNKRLTLVNKELEAFSYSISHDLRAPLRGISGYANILLQDHGSQLDEKGVKALNTIKNSAAGLNLLINDLLSFAKLGNEKIQRKLRDLEKLIEEILASLNLEDNYSNTQISIKNGFPGITGDEKLIFQLYSNLIENALKYSSGVASPTIEMGAMQQSEQPDVFYVRDNGIGFNPKLSNKIFDVFSRLVGEEYAGTR
ncbi:GAF domain-containing protein [Antarcticibacterium sp. 1MA-6-2]|uniref:histidine kinase dimerization/phospho-acceptor domain-containing protein n=1 Tax=Antarcticibacterium sp. 1MA-6-2 TaxID=2908210 RepID=UPI001F47EBBF|nr:histidine kinase dimerization/phospho-acceptor domain-containing protein [Antarcticibacterium sp. 1MA-6-2]UJH91360.1 GAF domain-containing protein [Antarcticibacterium sp. 1MA-6-2]